MDKITQIEVTSLEKRAAVYEEHADEREARAGAYYRFGSSAYVDSLDKVEQMRAQARSWRDEADELRRRSA